MLYWTRSPASTTSNHRHNSLRQRKSIKHSARTWNHRLPQWIQLCNTRCHHWRNWFHLLRNRHRVLELLHRWSRHRSWFCWQFDCCVLHHQHKSHQLHLWNWIDLLHTLHLRCRCWRGNHRILWMSICQSTRSVSIGVGS